MRVQVVNILCLHHLPARLPALGIAFMVVFCVFFFFILVFNYSLKPYLQKLTNISSWVIIYLLFFPTCGFELSLLHKHQKVLKVQATLMNALLTQLSAFQVILSFLLFFSVCFSGDWDFLFCMRVCLGRKSRLPRTPTLKGLLDITVYRDTKY